MRRTRHQPGALVVVSAVLVTASRHACGFQIGVPRCSSSRSYGGGSSSEQRAASRLPFGRDNHARQRVTSVASRDRNERSRYSGVMLLSEREGGGAQEQQSEMRDGEQEKEPRDARVKFNMSPGSEQAPTEVKGTTAAAAAAGVTVAAPRRYVGDGAGMGDEGGIGGPMGDGLGKEWTVDLCSKRLSLLHRKLRQVKSLQAQQARDPDSLDDAQRIKLGRKQNLVAEISELESLRRSLQETEEGRSATLSSSPPSGKEKRSRLPPGPFAGVSKAASDLAQQQQHIDDDDAQYTRDGLKLAAPRRRAPPPQLPPSRQVELAAGAASGAAGGAAALGDADLFGGAFDGEGDEFSMRAVITDHIGGPADIYQGGDGEFDWEEGREDAGRQPATAAARLSSSEAVELARPMVDAPTGGYPKRLAGVMSFCRVSDKATCEILVEMGRVTVNGKVATDPCIKVDLLADIVVANGVAVTFPGKIDNSDETRRPREDDGKRTGPIPKAEKNTWKQKTKYRWGMDDGLLAKRTRRAANAKSFAKKRRAGGMDYGDW